MSLLPLQRKRAFQENLARLVRAFQEALRPPEDINIWEWSDKKRVLPKTSSSESGPWRTERFPYLKEIMYEMSPQSAKQEVVVMGGSQTGKTEGAAINPMLYYIDHVPSPILYVQKTIEVMKRFSKQRLGPSIDLLPSIIKKVGDVKSRDGDNNTFQKSFPGGFLVLGGSNSAASLRSMPMAILLLDEIDSFVTDIQGEGDPVQLAVKRTTNFPKRKIAYISTPNIKETSRIEPLFLSGDQRWYHVPCPDCGGFQVIRWKNLVWVDDDPSTVKLACIHCGSLISESHKTEMLTKGKWIADNPGARRASFHISALYSPIGFYSWQQAVEDFLEADRERNQEKLKVWTNTVVGETWTMTGKYIENSAVERRREDYPKDVDVPAGALILTAGVDVQADRIEVEIVGWGKDLESWGIDYARFMGDTEGDQVWEDLDKYLLRYWKHESGKMMNVACAAVDSGHVARRVYKFVEQREFRRIFAVKGNDGWGKGLIDRPKTRTKDGIWLFTAWVDELKSKVYSSLSLAQKGPNFSHYPKKPCFDKGYFQMLTAERQEIRWVGAHRKLVWVLPAGRRNESLDCRCYAIAALNILNPNFDAIQVSGPVSVPTKPVNRGKIGVLHRGVQ